MSPELIVVVLVAVVALGPDKLPQVVRELTKLIREFRALTNNLQSQLADITLSDAGAADGKTVEPAGRSMVEPSGESSGSPPDESPDEVKRGPEQSARRIAGTEGFRLIDDTASDHQQTSGHDSSVIDLDKPAESHVQ